MAEPEPVVLLPRMGAPEDLVAALADALAGLGPVLTPDIGVDRSRPLRLENQALEVLAAISRADAERATLVGHGWGAAVALQVAAGFPLRVSGMVLGTNVSLPSMAARSLYHGAVGLLPALRLQRLPVPRAQILRLLDQARPVDLRPLARRVRARTLVAVGGRDLANRGASAELARALPTGSLRAVPDVAALWQAANSAVIAALVAESRGGLS